MDTVKSYAQQAINVGQQVGQQALNVGQQAVNAISASTKPASEQTILVTGASGFVAAHVLNSFLKAGYKVRGTVRSDQSANAVRKSHAKYADQLSFAIVKDVAAPGAFDEAVKGVDGVIHTASPFQMDVEDNERDLLDPAIKGTTGILEAIQKNNPDVKRVVITSSFASIIDMSKGLWPEHTYTEADWNPVTYQEAKEGSGPVAYCASKVFAEKAAFEYVEKNKPNFTVSTICPPMIYGPNEHEVTDLSKLNTSSADIYRLMNGSEKEVPDTSFFAFADVRDVGDAHMKAYETAGAAQQRYFITSGNFTYQEFCDIIRKNVPEVKDKVPVGKPGSKGPECYKVSNEKAKKELGLTFRSMEECVTDSARNLYEIEKRLGKA